MTDLHQARSSAARPDPLVAPGPELTGQQVSRYARHAILPGIGTLGQRRLLNAAVFVVGAGGLGSPTLLYLAAAGVGSLTVIDDDVVDESNLQRQIIHGVPDVGRAKVDSARDAIARIDPEIRVTTIQARLTAGNALDLLAGHDLILDGTDNFATRYLVADASEILGIPVVWGSILRFDGQVTTFWPGVGPVYRDLFPEPPDPSAVPSCAEAGVFGVLCAAVGSAMGAEAIRLITGTGRTLVGRFLIHDALAGTWRELTVKPDPTRIPVTDLGDYQTVCHATEQADDAALTARDLAELLAARERGDDDFVLVDVREPAEADLVRIDGSVLVPKDGILDGRTPVPADRPVILYCKGGVRSATVLAALRDSGRTDVRHLDGGVLAWIHDIEPHKPAY